MSHDEGGVTGPDLGNGIAASELAEGALLLGHVGSEPVLLTRDRGEALAVGAKCTHYGGPLAEGIVAGGTVRCPWHHAAFDLRTGSLMRAPGLDGIGCWSVVETDGIIRVTGRKPAVPQPVRGTARSHPESVVIIGGGAAGYFAAQTLRNEGYERPVTIVEAGPDAPYDRPNLSKDYLAGDAPEEWIPLRPADFYAEQGIELRLGAGVERIDTKGRRLVLDDGSSQPYGTLLIATGAEPIQLGGLAPGQPVHLLRTLGDSRAIIAAAEKARKAVVLGASFIGLEVAASLRARGLDVTVVAPDAVPLERVLGPELGAVIRAVHEAKGVGFRLGRKGDRIGRNSVTLDDGTELPADLVVAGIGVRPRTRLAEEAGLSLDRGILVDASLETSASGIFAAGDVARFPDPRSGERVRVEHWVVAERMGQAAARNMLMPAGERIAFDDVPFFWSRHYDLAVNYSGHAPAWDRTDVEGDLHAHDGTVTYYRGDQVLAAATIGRDRENLVFENALERGTPSRPG